MSDVAMRSYAGRCQYADKEQFYLGTVVLPHNAMQHEIDAALLELWGRISPHAPPPLVGIPGTVFFVPEQA